MNKPQKRRDKKQPNNDYALELVLANGRSQKFKSGYDMWKWASSTTKWKFELKYKD